MPSALQDLPPIICEEICPLGHRRGGKRPPDSGVSLQHKYMFAYLDIQRGVCMVYIIFYDVALVLWYV
jgi:hypothetical protein